MMCKGITFLSFIAGISFVVQEISVKPETHTHTQHNRQTQFQSSVYLLTFILLTKKYLLVLNRKETVFPSYIYIYLFIE